MKKRALFLGVFILLAVLVFMPGKSFASEIQDTGGGDATKIETDTEAPASGSDKAESYSQQVDSIIDNDFVPNVKAEDFFKKVNTKLAETMTFGQKVAAFILAMFFIVALVILAASALGSRKDRVVPCAVALLIIAIAFVGDIYVMDILGAFAHYMGS